MTRSLFVNVNYTCNERCVFCAAGLADGPLRTPGRPRGLTVDDLERFVAEHPAGPDDTVLVAGGEPTLHPDLPRLVRRASADGARVVLFTNGVRLADPAYAAEVVAAGVDRFEIALFGSTAARHEAVTRRAGSFDATLEALRVLAALDTEVEARLLVAAGLVHDLEASVATLRREAPGVDAVSLNRLILSTDAEHADAAVSWADARPAVNAAARAVLAAGWDLRHEAIPPCVFEGDVADHVAARLRERVADPGSLRPPEFGYLDPFVAAGEPNPQPVAGRPEIALPAPCLACDYLPACGRVEAWYVERFGTAGLRPVRLRAAAAP